MLYEASLLFAVGFLATWLFQFAAGTLDITSGWRRHALQLFILAVFAAYFLWCWLRGGQTSWIGPSTSSQSFAMHGPVKPICR